MAQTQLKSQRTARDWPFQVTPLHPVLGCEITGITLEQAVSPAMFAKVYEAFLDYELILFRDVALGVLGTNRQTPEAQPGQQFADGPLVEADLELALRSAPAGPGSASAQHRRAPGPDRSPSIRPPRLPGRPRGAVPDRAQAGWKVRQSPRH